LRVTRDVHFWWEFVQVTDNGKVFTLHAIRETGKGGPSTLHSGLFTSLQKITVALK